jgi:hypothetical protein
MLVCQCDPNPAALRGLRMRRSWQMLAFDLVSGSTSHIALEDIAVVTSSAGRYIVGSVDHTGRVLCGGVI